MTQPSPHELMRLADRAYTEQTFCIDDVELLITEHDDTPVVDDILAKIWTRNTIREQLSVVSRIKFDKVYAKIESEAIIPGASARADRMPTGISNRDVLRTALYNWRHMDSVDASSAEFTKEAEVIRAAGIITAEEVAKLLN